MNILDKDEQFEDEQSIYEVIDDQGIRRELVPIHTFDHNNLDYVVLVDRNDSKADGFIMRMELDEEELILSHIEDLEEWEAVEKIYNEISNREDQ